MNRPAFAAIAAALVAAPAPAQEPNKEAARFGAREAAAQVSLSPDGRRIAVLSAAPGGRGNVLRIGTVGGSRLAPILRSSGDPERLTRCRWSTDTRLVCEFYAIVDRGDALLGFNRVVSLDADGSNLKLLTAAAPERTIGAVQAGGTPIDWLGDEVGGKLLMTHAYGEQMTTGNLAASSKVGLGVDRVDTTTLKRTPVERPEPMAVEYISDGEGVVRVRGLLPPTNTGYTGDTLVYQ